MDIPSVIILDTVLYNVFIEYPSLKRKFEIYEGNNKGNGITGRNIRDVLGTNFEFTMTVRSHPDYPSDYDNFFEQIKNPVESHIITLPYGQSTITFEAMIESGEDEFEGVYAGYKRWDKLSLTVKTIEPYATSTPLEGDIQVWTIGGEY